MRAHEISASALCMAWLCAGCMADVTDATTSDLRRSDADCRADESCGEGDYGPADPPQPTDPVPPPPPETVPGCAATEPGFPSAIPYPTDHAARLRRAHWFGIAHGAATAYVNFHSADYGRGDVFGTVSLSTLAVAFRQEASERTLSYPTPTDVRQMMLRAQAYARGIGYTAALPTFEVRRDRETGDVVYPMHVLSPAAIELREVDGCELGDPNQYDVGAMYRGAHAYADRNGFVGGVPTFEVRYGGGRRFYTLILLRNERAEWSDVTRPNLDPECGYHLQRACDTVCADEYVLDFFAGGYCMPVPEAPPCGGRGERCCDGGDCREDLSCIYRGLFRPNVCGTPEEPTERCGDGRCTASEACWCRSDCANTELCRLGSLRQCREDDSPRTYTLCETCRFPFSGETVRSVTTTFCSEAARDEFLEIARDDGCTWAEAEEGECKQ